MNSYIKHIVEAFDFGSVNKQKKAINAHDIILSHILEKIDNFNFGDISKDEYKILTLCTSIYKVHGLNSLNDLIEGFIN